MSVTHSVSNSSLAICCTSSRVEPADDCAHSSQGETAQGRRNTDALDRQPIGNADHITCERIRKAIVADKGLSLYAHNVKIIAAEGGVTLKGVVRSDEEKKKIVSDVASVVAAEKVVDELTVRSRQASKEMQVALFLAAKEKPNVHHEYSGLRGLRDTGDRRGGRMSSVYARLH
jgi:hyperosmotically inducible protein